MKRDYLSDPQYNYESVHRASKACGPLVKWAIAQVLYTAFTEAHEEECITGSTIIGTITST